MLDTGKVTVAGPPMLGVQMTVAESAVRVKMPSFFLKSVRPAGVAMAAKCSRVLATHAASHKLIHCPHSVASVVAGSDRSRSKLSSRPQSWRSDSYSRGYMGSAVYPETIEPVARCDTCEL